jgi:hypothetical protein
MTGNSGDNVVTGDTSELPNQNQSSLVNNNNNFPSKELPQTTSTHEARHVPMNGNSIYANTYAYGPNFNQYDQQQDEISTSTLAAAITAGSLLGLTAAAAVRWLNGGDFTLFPPPTLSSSTTTSYEDDQIVTENYSHRLLATNRAQSSQKQDDDESSSLRELVSTIKSQTDRQEVLIKQLQDALICDKITMLEKWTDQSMKLLREEEKQGIEQMLMSILAELKTIRREIQDVKISEPSNPEIISSKTTTGIFWESRLSTIMERLDSALESIKSDVTSSINGNVLPSTAKNLAESNSLTTSSEPKSSMNESVGTADRLAVAISLLAMENELTKMRVGAQLLYLYVVNLASHPRVPRYRKIFTSNDSYQKNVAQLKGSREFLAAVGFVEQETDTSASYWEWSPSGGDGEDYLRTTNTAAREGIFLQRLKEAAAALSVLKTLRPDCDVADLLKLALSSANISATSLEAVEGSEKLENGPPSSTTTFTPTRTPSSTIGHDNHIASVVPDDAYVYQTPGNGSILSPPTTKKQSCLSLPPADFSSLEQPLLGIGKRPDVVKDESAISNRSLKEPLKTVNEMDSVDITSSDSSLEESAEASLWK